MSITWEDNAAAFAALDKQEGWPFARLVACSVSPGISTGNNQHEGVTIVTPSDKVGANAFAKKADTSTPRVMRFLLAWDTAADLGLCVPSGDLTPDDAHTTPEPDLIWGKAYDSRTGLSQSKPGTPSATRATAIREQAKTDGVGPSKAIDIASNPKALAAAIKADPATANAAAKALSQSSHRVLGKSPTTPEGREMTAKLQAANAAAKSVALVLLEASNMIKLAITAYGEHPDDLTSADAYSARVILTEIIVQAESLKTSILLDSTQVEL